MKDNEEIQKLELKLASKEAELERRYKELGKSLLELAGHEQRLANRLVDGIIEVKKQLALAKDEKQCPKCAAYNSGDSRYCKRCGLPLENIEVKDDERQ